MAGKIDKIEVRGKRLLTIVRERLSKSQLETLNRLAPEPTIGEGWEIAEADVIK